MNILILISRSSWMQDYRSRVEDHFSDHKKITSIKFETDHAKISDDASFDAVFFLSYFKIVEPKFLKRFKYNMVVHGSDLPRGRGMSPITWQVLDNQKEIPMVLFEAETSLDSGDIFFRDTMELNGTELVGELRAKQVESTVRLMDQFVEHFPNFVRQKQVGVPSYYEKRTPSDSRLDPYRPLSDQFDLLRVSDYDRYPTFFQIRGQKYNLYIEKIEESVQQFKE